MNTRMKTLAAALCGLLTLAAVAAEPVPLFSGSDSYVDLGTPAALQIPSNEPFTVEGWMLFDTLKSRDMLYCKSAGRTSAYSYMLGFADGKLAAYNTAWRGNFVVSRETNRWCHVAFSFDGTNMAFYLDGDLLGVAAFSFNNNLAHTVKIGGFSSTSDIDGSLSDVRVWSYARSQADLQGAMSNRLTGVESGLLGYWPLNEEGGATVYDQSANASDGEVIGAGWTHTDTLPLQPSAAGFEFFRPFVLADLETGSTRFTNSNEVDVIDLPVPEGCDGYQLNFLADAASLDPEAWSATNALPTRLSFARPLGDDDIHFYAWFTNTADTVTVRRSAARIRYTDAPPVPAVLPTHFRQKISGQPVTLLPAEIDNGSTGGESGGEAIPIHATRLALVSGPDTNATPDEPFVTVSKLGTYAVELVVMNTAGNVATSAVCEVTVTAYGGDPFVWTGAFDDDWHNPLNWNLHAVPVAGSEAVIGSGSVLLTNATEGLGAFVMTGGTLTFNGWETSLLAENVIVSNGNLTHALNTDTAAPWEPNARVYIRCTNMTLHAAATINVLGKGFRGGVTGSLAGKGPGGGGSAQHGGGYGGRGGHYHWGTYSLANVGLAYGEPMWPDLPGSGGGGSAGFAGGGAIRIEAADLLTLNGTINADSSARQNYLYQGGGSGGGVTLVCRRLAGIVKISADGTAVNTAWGYNRGGGGGGRIAIHYDSAAQAAQNAVAPPVLQIWANQGLGPFLEERKAHPGSIYLTDLQIFPSTVRGGAWYGFDTIDVPALTVDNGWAVIPDGVPLVVGTNIVVQNGEGRLELRAPPAVAVGGDFTVTGSASVILTSAATNETSELWGTAVEVGGTLSLATGTRLTVNSQPVNGGSARLTAGNIDIAEGATVSADAGGFAGGVAADGYGIGGGGMGTANATSSSGGGGGYGGHGGRYQTRGAGGIAYGLRKTPLHPGSGGGGRLGLATAGGAGGGLIRMHAEGQLTVNGTITANGATATHANVGGGSGGSIYLTCRALAGAGTLTANGGALATSGTSGAGGGGRIAIWRATDRPGMAITATAAAGAGSSQNGLEAGTVYWSQPVGTVLLLR